MTRMFHQKYAGLYCLIILNLIALGGASSPAGAQAPPIPYVEDVSPASAALGGPSFTLTIYGANFNSTSQVSWTFNGVTTPLQPYAVSTPHVLTVPVDASLVTSYGTAAITVHNNVGLASN